MGSLDKLATDEVAARVLHAGVGGISESDVTLAEASGVPIAFNVRANKEARESAERVGIEIRYYNIIYDFGSTMLRKRCPACCPLLASAPMPGNAQILEIFKIKVGNIAGCRVTDGTVERKPQRADPRQWWIFTRKFFVT